MDIKREGVARQKLIRRIIYLILTVSVLGAFTWQIMKLKPAAPSVELATVWPDYDEYVKKTTRRIPVVICETRRDG